MRHTRNATPNLSTEIEQAASADGWDAGWIVLSNGFQAGGTLDASGAGDAVFPTRGEALEFARTLGHVTVGDLARRMGWDVYDLDAAECQASDDVCGLSRCSYSRLERRGAAREHAPTADGRLFLVPDVLGGSDYSGSSLERANYRAFLASFGELPGVVDLHGGHGTYAVAIRLDVDNADTLEMLERLADYPVVDDDTLSEIESEADAEAWTDWAESEFRSALERRNGCTLDEIETDALRRLFAAGCETSGEYFHDDGASRYVDTDKVAAAVPLADLQALQGVTWDDNAADVQVRAERRDLEHTCTRSTLESHGWGGTAHRLRTLDPDARTYPRAVWAEADGNPARSACVCETCGRTGWINVRPAPGEPTHGGPAFLAHCGHGADPREACAACGKPREGAPGILGPWHPHGFAGAKVGEPCPLRNSHTVRAD